MKEPVNTAIQVIDRAMWLLDTLAGYDEPVPLKFLSADTGLHPSTAFRILSSLVEHGLVQRSPNGHYTLGPAIGRLARHVHAHLDLKELAKPTMDWLRDQLGETVNLSIRQGGEVIYIERSLSTRMMRVEQIIGSRAPLHVTAVGKLMLGEEADQQVRAYADHTGLPSLTHNTIGDAEELLRQVHRAKRLGYALDNEEAEIGVGCIGTLIYGEDGKVVAGLSVSAPIERRHDSWVPLVQEAARRISTALGYREAAVEPG